VIVWLLVSIVTVADVACGESSHAFTDAKAVAGVIMNRARARGVTPLEAATRRGQFARGCRAVNAPSRLTWRHLAASTRAHLGIDRRPAWLTEDVLWFCAEAGPEAGCARWREPGSWGRKLAEAGRTYDTRPHRAGRLMHRYWRMP
jgi:hypothetical protein